jgi:hypothetical protein
VRGRALFGVLMATALLAAPPADARTKRPCDARAGHTVKQSPSIRVYYVKSGQHQRDYYACSRRPTGRPLGLGMEKPGRSVGRFEPRGHYLAYVVNTCPRGGPCGFSVFLVDLRTRYKVQTDPAPGRVLVLVASKRGAVAVLAAEPGTRTLQKLDSLGASEVDRGPDLRALTLRNGRIHWLHGDQRRSQAAAHARRCGPIKGASTVALGRNTRVYQAEFSDLDDVVYACLLGEHSKMRLGSEGASSGLVTYLGEFRLAGDHVVWLDYSCYLGNPCNTALHSADVRAQTARQGANQSEPDALVANAYGFAAEALPSGAENEHSVAVLDSDGYRVVDSGAGIDPQSLTIDAAAAHWTHDGEPRAEPLR